MKVKFVASTDGSGFWSRDKRNVQITQIEVITYGGENFGELRAYFLKKSWNLEKHGLIYTDNLWMKQFRKHLQSIGFSEKAAKDVDYSEQGMQGNNYVSMDVGAKFIKEWNGNQISSM